MHLLHRQPTRNIIARPNYGVGSPTAGKASHAGQALSAVPDKDSHPGFTDGGWAWRYNLISKKFNCLETPGNGEAMARKPPKTPQKKKKKKKKLVFKESGSWTRHFKCISLLRSLQPSVMC
jgi:hypothetical protein